MPSATSNTQLRIRFFLKVATLLLYAKFKKIPLMPYSFHRSAKRQNLKYQQGRTLPGKIITYADGYEKESRHQHWTAIDFVIVLDDELKWKAVSLYTLLGKFWKRMGGKWGGDFLKPNGQPMGDYGHFQN